MCVSLPKSMHDVPDALRKVPHRYIIVSGIAAHQLCTPTSEVFLVYPSHEEHFYLLLDLSPSCEASHCPRVPDFGSKPSPRRRAELEKLHPAGLTDDWADKLAGRAFYSHNQKATFEHYLQACPGRSACLLEVALHCPAALQPMGGTRTNFALSSTLLFLHVLVRHMLLPESGR